MILLESNGAKSWEDAKRPANDIIAANYAQSEIISDFILKN